MTVEHEWSGIESALFCRGGIEVVRGERGGGEAWEQWQGNEVNRCRIVPMTDLITRSKLELAAACFQPEL